MKTSIRNTGRRRGLALIALMVLTMIAASVLAEGESHDWGPASDLTVDVRNRLYPDFQETQSIGMNERVQVGDTDFYFEVVDFFPHFALIDSTKEVISLSHEPDNVAFKFVVYENDSIIDTSWSFYNLQVPHYSRTSFLYFNVTRFIYRDETYEKTQQ
jgi:hypothetical protein